MNTLENKNKVFNWGINYDHMKNLTLFKFIQSSQSLLLTNYRSLVVLPSCFWNYFQSLLIFTFTYLQWPIILFPPAGTNFATGTFEVCYHWLPLSVVLWLHKTRRLPISPDILNWLCHLPKASSDLNIETVSAMLQRCWFEFVGKYPKETLRKLRYLQTSFFRPS